MQCLVWSYCSGYSMSSERMLHCLRHPLPVWHDYHNLLLSITLLLLSFICCFVMLLSILFLTSLKDQSGYPHTLRALLTCINLLFLVFRLHYDVGPLLEGSDNSQLVEEAVVGLKIKVLVGLCLFSIYFHFQCSIIFSGDLSIYKGDFRLRPSSEVFLKLLCLETQSRGIFVALMKSLVLDSNILIDKIFA